MAIRTVLSRAVAPQAGTKWSGAVDGTA